MIVEVTWRDHWWTGDLAHPGMPDWTQEFYCHTVGVLVEERQDELVVAHEWSMNNETYRGTTFLLKATVVEIVVHGSTKRSIPQKGVIKSGQSVLQGS